MNEFGIVDVDIPLHWTARLNAPDLLQLLGCNQPVSLRKVWSQVPVDERAIIADALRRVFSGATVFNMLVPLRTPKGRLDLLVRGKVHGQGVKRLDGVVLDITHENTRLRELQIASSDRAATAVQELNHRVRNIMSVVSALITLSGRYAEDVEDFSRATLYRIQALNVAYSNTGIDPINPERLRQTVDLRVLAEGVLTPLAVTRGSFLLPDTHLYLSPGQASALGLILHELGSNAAEHGALRQRGGSVELGWEKRGRRFCIEWAERGCKSGEAFTDGFGISIIKLFSRNYLNGEAEWAHRDDGLTVRIIGFEH
jgi:two-component sensor histidine kinase